MRFRPRMGRLCVCLAAMMTLHAPAFAADHRDSPSVDNDISTDINDIFAFRSPTDSTKLELVLTTHPLEKPSHATTYHYQHLAVYRFFFTTDPKARPTANIDFTFSQFENGQQSYTAVFPNAIVVKGLVTQATINPGPANPPIITKGPPGSGIQIFAGPRDDPFFFDFDGFERFVAGTGTFTGNDSFAGENVHAIVVEVPIALVSNGASKFGIWGVTYMTEGDDLQQIDRMGNPAVNTAFIPAALKDAYNQGSPETDAKRFAPAILATLASFKTPPANVAILASVVVPDTLKFDTTKPDGFPNGRRLQDHPTDTILQLVINDPSFTDGVTGNDVPFLTTFPFLAPPHQQP